MNQPLHPYFKSLLLLVVLVSFYGQTKAQSAPTTFGDVICAGDSGFVYVTPQAGFTYNWYDAMSGGNLLGTGDTLFVGPLASTTTYYVEGVSTGGSTNGVGPTDNTIAGGTNYTALQDGLVFTVQNDTVQLDTVFVYPNGPGNVVINLRTTSNVVLQTATVQTTTTTKTAIPVGFCIPPGTYRLNAVGTTTGGLFRNTGGAQYPYTSPNINITGAINTSTTFYYLFYDWKYRVGCGPNGGTTARAAATVTVNPLPVVNLGPDVVICGNQSVQVQTSGSGTYLWSDGSTGPVFTIDSAGTYWLQCTDANGCTNSDTIDATSVVLPDLGLPDDTLLCDSTLVLCVPNSPSATYIWSDGSIAPCVTIATPGTYFVTCTDSNGCSVNDTVNVTLNFPPNAGFIMDTSMCPIVLFDVPAVPGNDTYSWDFGDSTTDTLPNPTHTYASNGTYTVTLTTTGPCGTATSSQQLDINCIVGVDGGLPAGYTVYPNPSNGEFFLDYPVRISELTVEVYDQLGSLVLERVTNGQEGRLEIKQELARGLYLMTIQRDGKRYAQRILIK